VPKSARRGRAMELAVLRMAGIPGERRPHLTRAAFVPRDRDHVGIGDVVRTQKLDIAGRHARRRFLNTLLMGWPSAQLALSPTARDIASRPRVAGEKCCIREEVRDAVFS